MRHLAFGIAGIALFAAAGAEAKDPQLPGRASSLIPSMASTQRSLDYSTRGMMFDSRSSRGNGFIAAVPISSAATIGLGRFYSMPRRRMGAQEQPVMIEGRKPRRAAVGLSLKF